MKAAASTRPDIFLCAALLCLGAPAWGAPRSAVVNVGSKAFTEGVILGELVTQVVRSSGARAVHRRELGGTKLLWSALLEGAIDVYPEYTGTIREEILAGSGVSDDAAMAKALADRGVRVSASLGFNNSYAIGMRENVADRLGIRTISDLARYPQLKFGFSNEFMDREDGWPALRKRYGLPQRDVRGMDHDLAYRALASGAIDATDLYSTDAEILYYRLRVLEDNLRHFREYTAVLLYRADLENRAPQAISAFSLLEGRISESDMQRMNGRAKLERTPEAVVAGDYLAERLGIQSQASRETITERLLRNLREHLYLVAFSLLAAIVFSVPMGILAARRPKTGQVVLAVVGLVQTIPSLALLVFMIPLLGIGARPSIVALFLYSLLPIVRNTCTGLQAVPREIRESAEALGLPSGARLRLVELPMASPAILAGIKTSAIINVGTATLGALIGAGGFGQPILTGIRLNDVGLILQGAVPAALLALLVQAVFETAERFLVPKGLRLSSSR
jgi:osmoprotectant transport system permease protein